MNPDLQKFLAVASEQTTGKGTTESATNYVRENKGIKNNLGIEISFGAEQASAVPWIAFTGYNQIVENGIYPVYLYYKDFDILILAYGVSGINSSSVNWISSSITEQTIKRYFKKNLSQRTNRYGDSFVYKVYDTKQLPNNSILEEDLKSITEEYKKLIKGQSIDFKVTEPKNKKIKEKSSVKNDITIQIEDPKTFFSPILGFSIKSQLGQSSTLVNATNQTNFTYTLSRSLSEEEIKEINNLKNFCDKFTALKKYGVSVDFEGVDSPKYSANFQSIDSAFEKVIGQILKFYYQSEKSEEKTIIALTKKISDLNPLKLSLDINPSLYEMMMKKFLTEHALGMMPGKVWHRDYKNSAGFLVVRKDGEILCYHFYFIKNFENYLFQNTKLETPSSSRYRMMEFYQENGVEKFKLNLQIRFIK